MNDTYCARLTHFSDYLVCIEVISGGQIRKYSEKKDNLVGFRRISFESFMFAEEFLIKKFRI